LVRILDVLSLVYETPTRSKGQRSRPQGNMKFEHQKRYMPQTSSDNGNCKSKSPERVAGLDFYRKLLNSRFCACAVKLCLNIVFTVPYLHNLIGFFYSKLQSLNALVKAVLRGCEVNAIEISILRYAYNDNNNNNNHDDIYSAVIYSTSHMREFTVVPLGQSRSAPGGRQLAGQRANLTFESACRLL